MKTSEEKDPAGAELEQARLERELGLVLEQAGLEAGRAIEPALRSRPTTGRGRETVDRLLDAGLDVTAREGIRGVNTRAVAAEAGVNIATLYQYFEDIDSLLLAAVLRDHSVRSQMITSMILDLVGGMPLREWIDSIIELMIERTVESERRRAVVKIAQALPAVQPTVTLSWETGAKLLAIGFSFRYGEDPDEYWLPITRTINSTTRLVMDDAMLKTPTERDRVDRVVQMCFEYLEARVPAEPETAP